MTVKQVIKWLETNKAYTRVTFTRSGITLHNPYTESEFLTIKELERRIEETTN